MPHWPWSLWCPCISSSRAGVRLPSSSLFERKLAVSLVLLDGCVPFVVPRRIEGREDRNLIDLEDVLSSETASSSSLDLSLLGTEFNELDGLEVDNIAVPTSSGLGV